VRVEVGVAVGVVGVGVGVVGVGVGVVGVGVGVVGVGAGVVGVGVGVGGGVAALTVVKVELVRCGDAECPLPALTETAA
jgi:hypothetical protein